MVRVTPEEIAAFKWVSSGIPQRFWNQGMPELSGVLDDAAPNPNLDLVCEWVTGMPERQRREDGIPVNREQYGVGILLCGDQGTGKTTLACAAATSVKRSYGKSVYFTRWASYLNARLTMNSPDFDYFDSVDLAYATTVRQVAESFLLVLDDVGHEHSSGSGYGERLLDELLRTRFDAGMPTIITTNLTAAEWMQRYDAVFRSFMRQACPPIYFGGSDRRAARPRAQ